MPRHDPPTQCDECGAQIPGRLARIKAGGVTLCPDCYEKYRGGRQGRNETRNAHPGRGPRGQVIEDEARMNAEENARRKRELEREMKLRQTNERINARIKRKALEGKQGRPAHETEK